MKELTVYLCPRCDRPYYQTDREDWENNRAKHGSIAKSLKAKHKCPWERGRKTK